MLWIKMITDWVAKQVGSAIIEEIDVEIEAEDLAIEL